MVCPETVIQTTFDLLDKRKLANSCSIVLVVFYVGI